MSDLFSRSGSACELCTNNSNLAVYAIPPYSDGSTEQSLLICDICTDQINNPQRVEPNHWRCLNDSMWSQVPAVQVVVWRMLTRLTAEGWPRELLDRLYLDDETLAWANVEIAAEEDFLAHKDSNGSPLAAGDTVTLIKDLDVKGTSFVAKRGTSVRNISLVKNNEQQIEGRVNGTQIVILTKFVKRAN